MVGQTLGMDDIRSNLLPGDKQEAVSALHLERHGYGSVAMVGDGINDAPALAAADLGIAMGDKQEAAAHRRWKRPMWF